MRRRHEAMSSSAWLQSRHGPSSKDASSLPSRLNSIACVYRETSVAEGRMRRAEISRHECSHRAERGLGLVTK